MLLLSGFCFSQTETIKDSAAVKSKITDIPFKIFPNPGTTQQNIYINFEKKVLIKQLEVFDLVGKRVFNLKKTPINNNKINLGNFGRGIFLVRLRTSDGSATKKMVIQ
jgi:hypothetical protein